MCLHHQDKGLDLDLARPGCRCHLADDGSGRAIKDDLSRMHCHWGPEGLCLKGCYGTAPSPKSSEGSLGVRRSVWKGQGWPEMQEGEW